MSANPFNQSIQQNQHNFFKDQQFLNSMNFSQPNQQNISIQKQPMFQNIQTNNLQTPQSLYESQQFNQYNQPPPQVQMMDMFQKMMTLMTQNGLMNPSTAPLQSLNQSQYQVNPPPTGPKQVEDRFNNQMSDMKSFYNMQPQQGIPSYNNQDLGKNFLNQEKNQNNLDNSQILDTKSDFVQYDHNTKKSLKSNNFQLDYDNNYNEFIQNPVKDTGGEFQYIQNKENLNKNQENQNNYFKNKKISQLDDVQIDVNNFSSKSNQIDSYFNDKSQDYSVSNADYQNLNNSIRQHQQSMTEFDDYVIGNHDQQNTNQSYNDINNISSKYQFDDQYQVQGQIISRKNISNQDKLNTFKDNQNKNQNNSYQNNDYDEIPIKKQNKFKDNQNQNQNNSYQNNDYDEIPLKKQNKIQNNSYQNNDYDEIPIKKQNNNFNKNQNNDYDDIPMKKQNKMKDNFMNNNDECNEYDTKPIIKSNKNQKLSIDEKVVNEIDEIPINIQGSSKNFEQMIQEQLEKEEEAIRNGDQEEFQKPKKQFLKKQSGVLSNANVRSKAATQHIQAIQEQSYGSEDVIQIKKQIKKNTNQQSEPKQQKNNKFQQVESQIMEPKQQKKNSVQSQKANNSESEIQKSENDNVPKKNFLKRGEGKLGTGKNQNSSKKLKTTAELQNNDDDEDYYQNSNQEPKYEAQKYLDSDKKEIIQQYDFDDDKAWNDNEVKIDEKEVYQSRIVDKYFGGGNKQNQQNHKEKEQNNVMIDYNNLTPEIEKQIVEKYMNDKIEELNREVEKFKLENERVKKMRTKYEDLLKQLNKQQGEFQKQKEQEIADLEEWKNEEKKKTRNEKKLQEKTRSQLQNIPNRKERDEIESYKKEIQRLKDEMKAKDQRTKLTTERMKKQMDELIQINKEQGDEIKALEYQRIESKQLDKKTSSFQINHNSKSDNQTNSKSVSKIFSTNDSVSQKVTMDHFKVDNQNDSSDHQDEDDNNDEIGDYEDIINVKQGVKDIKKSAKQPIFDTKKTQINNPQNSKKQEIIPQQSIQQSQNQQPKIQQNKQKSKSLFDLNQKYGLSIKLINDGLVDDNDFSYDQNQSYVTYQASKSQLTKIVQQNVAQDGKIQRLYADGKKEIVFHNSVKKESFNDGYTIVHFTNQDIKQTLPCGSIIYYFAEANTTQTTIPNGPNIYKFANNQIEMHLKNGLKEIKFSDGTEKRIQQNGEEYTRFNDGTVQKIDINKIKTVEYPNGQTEIVYPDGTKMRKNAADDEFAIIEEEDDE